MKKNIIIKIGIFCLLLSIIGIPIYGVSVTKGDINANGKIDIRDCMKILHYISGKDTNLSNDELEASDVTGDGKVDSRDAHMILYSVSGQYTGTFPVTLSDYGDLNRDGKISIVDSSKLFGYIDGRTQLTPQELAVSDVNADMKINLADAQILFQVVQGRIISPLPTVYDCVGDLNQDKIVNDSDVIILQNYINSGNTTYKLDYDINHDGKVDNLDVDEIYKIIDSFGKQLTFEKHYFKISSEEKIVSLIDGKEIDNQILNWTTSNDNIAEVVNGTIIPIGDGICTITAKTVDGSNLSHTCRVMVDFNNKIKITAGDVNEDGVINIFDSIKTMHYLSGKNRDLSMTQLLAADVTGDGNLDTRDGFMLFYKVSGRYTGNFPVTLSDYGDLNGDGKIGVTDAMILFHYVNGKRQLTPQELAVADANGDMKISIADAQLIFHIASGRIEAVLPYNYKYVGDLNEDEIVNHPDVVVLQNYLNKRSVNYQFEYDINHDGLVDNSDVTELNQLVESFGDTLTLNKTAVTIVTKSNEELTALIDGNVINNEMLSWSTSNPNVAEVVNGVIIPIGNGSCEITCKTTDGSSISKNCQVTVDFKVTSITLNKEELTFKDKTAQALSVVVGPGYAKNKNVTWTSNDERVAKVSSTGVVTPVGNGNCEIICKTTDGSNISKNCQVTVDFKVTDIRLNKIEYIFNSWEAQKVAMIIEPNYAKNKNVIWTSNNEKVAKVNEEGIITPLGNGSCKITCKATDGSNISKVCNVIINIPYSKGDYNKDNKVDVTDVYHILTAISKNTKLDGDIKELVDMNEDGKVDVTDAYLLLLEISKI